MELTKCCTTTSTPLLGQPSEVSRLCVQLAQKKTKYVADMVVGAGLDRPTATATLVDTLSRRLAYPLTGPYANIAKSPDSAVELGSGSD